MIQINYDIKKMKSSQRTSYHYIWTKGVEDKDSEGDKKGVFKGQVGLGSEKWRIQLVINIILDIGIIEKPK